jgi:hypothetical protein
MIIMRKKIIGVIIFLIAISLLTLGIIGAEFLQYPSIYNQMAAIP